MQPPSEPIDSGEVLLPDTIFCFLYRVYDTKGDLLYIGIAGDVGRRVGHHHTGSPRGYDIARVTWERYSSRDEAAHAERYWIHHLAPRYNRADNARRRIAVRAGHSRPYDADAWRRLGESVKSARLAAGLALSDAAATVPCEVELLQALEEGQVARFDAEFLKQIEVLMGWAPGAVEMVLQGGEPLVLSAAERLERVRAAYVKGGPGFVGDRL